MIEQNHQFYRTTGGYAVLSGEKTSIKITGQNWFCVIVDFCFLFYYYRQ